MPTLPSHLEADLESVYTPLLLTTPHVPIQGVDNMAGYPPALVGQETTWSASDPDPADPTAHLEHDDNVSVEDNAEGRRIMPMPELFNPGGPATLKPNLAEAESRPISPLLPARLPPTDPSEGDPELPSGPRSDAPSEASGVSARRTADLDANPEEKPVPGPLKVDPTMREKYRRRLREALEIVGDESKPLTLGSLVTVVEEIAELDARMRAMEQALAADRHSTRYLIGKTAQSEAAASETRMRAEVATLRQQVDTWRNQVPTPAQPPEINNPAQTGVNAIMQTRRVKRGYRRG